MDLSHGLRVHQSPEVADHPHGGGFEYLILSCKNGDSVDVATEEVCLQDIVVVVHEIIPQKRRHQELDPDAEHRQEWFLVGTPQILEAITAAGR